MFEIAYYNADLLDAAGVDADAPPADWETWRQAAQRISRHTGDPTLYIGISEGDTWAAQTLISCNGGDLLACQGGQAASDAASPAAVEALELWSGLVRDGLALNALRDQGAQAFLSGRVAVYLNAVSARAGLEEQAGFDLRATQCPSFGAKPLRLPAGGNALVVLARDEKRLEAAWAWVRELLSPAALTAWTKGTGYLPPRAELLDDPAHLQGFLRDNPIEAVGAEHSERIVPWTSFPGDEGLDAQETLYDAVSRALGGQASAARALGDADRRIDGMLDGVRCT
jgi:multiple sugar transport system substrate-binding protein